MCDGRASVSGVCGAGVGVVYDEADVGEVLV